MVEQGEAPIGHVVHLVRTLDDSTAPERIGLPTRMGTGGRIVVWLLVGVGAVGTGILLLLLWTGDSPWWFNLIFTFMPGFVVGFAVAFADSTRRARTEEVLALRWAEARGMARSGDGRVVDRQVSLTEHGGVSAFTLTVTDPAGSVIRARWFRSTPDAGDVTLLQTQVPALGSRVRIWQIGSSAEEDAPVIVEALDPSIVSST
ncbi:hypothetical protein M2317_002919 [Microbacterium sp. ZKA21]|uniref:hypothetical protein n=1 Tax=Microbacterium sp. ZKA21 TaxID=3381694 RepID=UPI003D25CC80